LLAEGRTTVSDQSSSNDIPALRVCSGRTRQYRSQGPIAFHTTAQNEDVGANPATCFTLQRFATAHARSGFIKNQQDLQLATQLGNALKVRAGRGQAFMAVANRLQNDRNSLRIDSRMQRRQIIEWNVDGIWPAAARRNDPESTMAMLLTPGARQPVRDLASLSGGIDDVYLITGGTAAQTIAQA
jgi:hypothetical protein